MVTLGIQHCSLINGKIQSISLSNDYFQFEDQSPRGFEAHSRIIQEHCQDLPRNLQMRLQEEYFGYGPIKPLLEDPSITEIIVNGPGSLWIEQRGQLVKNEDCFLSEQTYTQFLQRLYLEVHQEPTLTHPFIDSSWKGHRLHIAGPYGTDQNLTRISVRKHPSQSWSLDELGEMDWAPKEKLTLLSRLIKERKNFLVIGPTGSGKTSVLKALLTCCAPNERILVLEDSFEIAPPNEASTHLLTRHDSRNVLAPITLTDLVRQSLRMRPDRIIVGEVRGAEAKDLLLALATGHDGSASTLHASDAGQALIRLEMLIQMGAPHWNLQAIRRLIHLSLDYLIVCTRRSDGRRALEGLYRIVSAEESGLIIERADAF